MSKEGRQMPEEGHSIVEWLLGVAGIAITSLLGIWYKIEERQDAKIEELRRETKESHKTIHMKIDSVKNDITVQHLAIRDKIEDIWKHIVRDNRS